MPVNRVISTRNGHCLFIDPQGFVNAFGESSWGQLSQPTQSFKEIVVIEAIVGAISVSAGHTHSLVLDYRGQVWAFGSKANGKLGLPYNCKTIRDIGLFDPVVVRGLPIITQISAGKHHSLFLDINGRVWSTGSNKRGQLGMAKKVGVPAPIFNLPKIVEIAAGNNYSLCLDHEGQVWIFGRHRLLSLIEPLNLTGIPELPVEVQYQPLLVKGLPRIRSITTGGHHHNICIDTNGGIWGFGYLYDDIYRKPFLLESIPNVVSAFSEVEHNLMLDREGFLWSYNVLPPIVPNVLPSTELSTEDDGRKVIYGQVPDVSGIKTISIGSHYFLLVDYEGKLKVYAHADGWHVEIEFKHPTISIEPFPVIIESPILTTYAIIRDLLEGRKIKDFFLRTDLGTPDSKSSDTVVEFETKNGNRLLSRVRYDPLLDQVDSPLEDFPLITKLIGLRKNGHITRGNIRLRYGDNVNHALEFEDPTNQYRTCLIKVSKDFL